MVTEGGESDTPLAAALFRCTGFCFVRGGPITHMSGNRVYQDLTQHLLTKSCGLLKKRPHNIRAPFFIDFAKFQTYDAS